MIKRKSTQGDIQMLLSVISISLAVTMLTGIGIKVAAAENYIDPITIKDDVAEEVITTESTTTSEVRVLNIIDDEDEEVEPYQEIVEDTTILPNSLEREWITIHSDLHVDTCPSAETLDKLIDWWAPRIMENRGTPFVGHGKDFYAVWEMTGMDPLIILGIAAWEGGWGNSRVAKAKYNFYGIGVYDSDPLYWASTFAGDESDDFENVSKGIIDGALWIYENYYTKGNTTLALINNNGYNGYNGGTYWAETITEEMINVHYRVVADILSEEE